MCEKLTDTDKPTAGKAVTRKLSKNAVYRRGYQMEAAFPLPGDTV